MVISKKTIIFQGFRGGPVQLFPWGPNANFYRTHITCCFNGGGGSGPLSPLWIHTCWTHLVSPYFEILFKKIPVASCNSC